MVVGRCPNGWMPNGVHSCQFDHADFRNQYATEVREASLCHPQQGVQGQCPMGWLMEINVHNRNLPFWQTPFWRVIKGVTRGLVPQATCHNWFSYLAWSNLYKLAPWVQGNPNGRLRGMQLAVRSIVPT